MRFCLSLLHACRLIYLCCLVCFGGSPSCPHISLLAVDNKWWNWLLFPQTSGTPKALLV